MAKRGKGYRTVAEGIDPDHQYSPSEAIALVKRTARAKFDETIEVAVRLGVDVKHADQMVRGSVILPHGVGREVRVAVFAKGDAAREAADAGADFVGAEDLVDKVEGGWLDFDVAVATPDMMSLVGRLGRVLGPRGLMPNPKSGTVTPDAATAVREVKAGKVEFRTERAGICHVPIGKASFGEEQLLENFETVIDALLKAKPAASKGQYVRSITVSATMGPGIAINPLRTTAAA